MNATVLPAPATNPWLRRARLLAAIAAIWCVLVYVVSRSAMPAGVDRPMTIAAAAVPFLAAVLLPLVFIAGTGLAAVLARTGEPGRGLLAAAAAAALWAPFGGTMTDWLLRAAPAATVAQPTGTLYWPLVGEALFFLVIFGLAGLLDAAIARGEWAGWRRTVGISGQRREQTQGLIALAITTTVILTLMQLLNGPAVAWTWRLQTYFAVAASTGIGIFIASRIVDVRQAIWFWPAPLLAGVIAHLIAALNPDLLIPAGYDHLNMIPAWGAARALPIEYAGVGIVAALWAAPDADRSADNGQKR